MIDPSFPFIPSGAKSSKCWTKFLYFDFDLKNRQCLSRVMHKYLFSKKNLRFSASNIPLTDPHYFSILGGVYFLHFFPKMLHSRNRFFGSQGSPRKKVKKVDPHYFRGGLLSSLFFQKCFNQKVGFKGAQGAKFQKFFKV